MVALAVERGQPVVSEQPEQNISRPEPEDATNDVTAVAEPQEATAPEAPQAPAPGTEEDGAAEAGVAPVPGTEEPSATELSEPAAEEGTASDAGAAAEPATEGAAEPATEATAERAAEGAAEPATDATAEGAAEPATEATAEPASEGAAAEASSQEAVAEVSEEATGTAYPPAAVAEPAEGEATPSPDPARTPTPGPRPGPSPAMFAARKPAAPRPSPTEASAATAPAPVPTTPSESVRHGRVGDDGTVYVIAADGTERAVGSYPDATPEEALAYFARKYDELVASADLLAQRVAHTDVSAHDARQSLSHLKEQIGEAHVVGDIAALEATVGALEQAIAARAAVEAEHRAAAKAQATTQRETLVAEAETLAATEPAAMQWKQASARVRELLDEWKAHQRSGPRLDKDVEGELWKRFSAARTAFDKSRKVWFARLDEEHGQARSVKEKLVKEAEALASSKDWGPTAGAFKRLMQDWKRAGRASRADDDALWRRFKAAQDAFFNAKDEVVAAEEAEYAENLKVKEELLTQAEALTIDEQHLESAKSELRRIQDRWDAAGKVPRADIRRVEGRLRAVEQQVRDLEDKQWQRSDPELTARATSMVQQLERQVQGLESDLAAARAAGDERRVATLESELATKKLWLDSARGTLS
jgi:polyhydroxyalkanoate synthesis regulator phasin